MWRFGRGVSEDLLRRANWYYHDWSLSHLSSTKVWASASFIFCISIAPAVTFAVYFTKHTDGSLGACEVLLSMGIVGVLFAVISGQPLTIVGITGPITILTAAIYTIAQAVDEPFLPFYACSQLWAAVMHFILAFFNACDLISWVTRYSCESFGILISLIYLYTGCEEVVKTLVSAHSGPNEEYVSGLLQFILAVSMVAGGMLLSDARAWTGCLTPSIRSVVADYGPSAVLVLCSAAAYIHRVDADHLPTLFLPTTFEPTSGVDRVHGGWLVDFTGLSTRGVFAAIIPGVVITVLFFFDHNVSSLIAQDPHVFHLSKCRSFYHWDIAVLGIGLIITGVMGLPPCNGLIPQAPLHTRSLIVDHKSKTVLEQRWTALFQSIGCGLGTVYPFSYMLRFVPVAVLSGMFVYLGLQPWREGDGNQFAMRIKNLLVCEADHPPLPMFESIAHHRLVCFTMLQVLVTAVIFGITFTPATVIFPVLIGLLVVVRRWVLPRIFDEESELNGILDSHLVVADDCLHELCLTVDKSELGMTDIECSPSPGSLPADRGDD